jgi:uncharacterized protein
VTSGRIITRELVSVVRGEFALDWSGVHGAPHWARVRENGLRLAAHTGARVDVIELFAFLHDTQRRNDGYDPDHGKRAADFAGAQCGVLFTLDDQGLTLLCHACTGHSDGLIEADITIQTCWDADRLDLGRVGFTPDPDKLCTTAARDPLMIEWAFNRSL